jgi:WD40 repeat protein
VTNVYLWSLANLQAQPTQLTSQRDFGYIRDLTSSPASRWLLTIVEGYGAELWDLSMAEPKLARQTPIFLPAETAAFSRDGHWLATGGNREMMLYNLTHIDNRSLNLALPPINLVSGKTGGPSIAFTHDSRQLIAAPERTTLRVWNLTTADPATNAADYPGQGSRLELVSADINGNWWIGAGQDGPYQLWPVSDGVGASEPRLIGFICCGRPIGISANDRWLVTLDGGDNIYRKWRGTLYLWHLDLQEMIDLTCKTVGRNLNTLEWAQYFRGEQPRPICPDFPFNLEP